MTQCVSRSQGKDRIATQIGLFDHFFFPMRGILPDERYCPLPGSQLFQPLGEKLSYYNGKWFSSHRFGFKAPET